MDYFIWNGTNSSDYLIINTLPSIIKPERNMEKVEIPGKNGFLTLDYNTYKSHLKSVECCITDLSNIDFIGSWLTGSGIVTFSNQPDKYFNAIIRNEIDISKVLSTFHSFVVEFECQPFAYALDDDEIIIIGNTVQRAGLAIDPLTAYNPTGLTVLQNDVAVDNDSTNGSFLNKGTINSSPVLTIYGTGDITITINGVSIQLTGVVDHITIDSQLMDCYKDTNLCNSQMNGDFPQLIPGLNTISWLGTVNYIDIKCNSSWL